MPNPFEVLLHDATTTGQLSIRFLLRVRRIDLCQPPGGEVAEQSFGVAAVCLDTVAGLDRLLSVVCGSVTAR